MLAEVLAIGNYFESEIMISQISQTVREESLVDYLYVQLYFSNSEITIDMRPHRSIVQFNVILPRLKGGWRLHRLHVFLIQLLVEAYVEKIDLHCLSAVCLECINFKVSDCSFWSLFTERMLGSCFCGYLGTQELIGLEEVREYGNQAFGGSLEFPHHIIPLRCLNLTIDPDVRCLHFNDTLLYSVQDIVSMSEYQEFAPVFKQGLNELNYPLYFSGASQAIGIDEVTVLVIQRA